MPDYISPFIATWGRYDAAEFRSDETSRQAFVREGFAYAERCRIHFERGNWALFDKESPPVGTTTTPRSRLNNLYLFYTTSFMRFTRPSDADRARIRQRLIYVKLVEPARFDELASYYLASGRIMSLWREIFSVRNSFVSCYNFIQPLIMVGYWQEEYREPVTLTDKRFNELRQLYIDCFETLCRLLVLAVGYEMPIQHGKLGVPTRTGSMTLEEFERMPNAAKRDHIPKMAIADLFLPVLDTDFRNGVGHHSAHYEQEPDAIVIFDSKNAGTVSRVMSYTEFCEKVLDLFAAFELAVRFHHDIHIYLDGRLA